MSTTSKPARKRISLYQGPKGGCSPDELEPMAAKGGWAFEQKHDGFWSASEVVDGIVVKMTSRVGLDMADGGLVGQRVAAHGSGVLVGEMVADLVAGKDGPERAGTRRLHFFDVLSWNGSDLTDQKLSFRRQALEAIVVPSSRVFLVEHRTAAPRAFYDEVVASGGEGLVAKRLDSIHRPTNSDGKVETWIRCKPTHTVDMVVIAVGVSKTTTTQPGGSPNLQLGLWKNFPHAGRKLVRVQDCAIPMWLRGSELQAAVGQVVEVEGAEVWPSGCVRHGQIKRMRPDKAAEDCTHEAARAARPVAPPAPKFYGAPLSDEAIARCKARRTA